MFEACISFGNTGHAASLSPPRIITILFTPHLEFRKSQVAAAAIITLTTWHLTYRPTTTLFMSIGLLPGDWDY